MSDIAFTLRNRGLFWEYFSMSTSKNEEDAAVMIYDTTFHALMDYDVAQLEVLTIRSPFPCGTDGWLGDRWLSTAVSCGNLDSVAWVLSKKPEVNYVDQCGFTVLKTALQGEQDALLERTTNRKSWQAISTSEASARTIKMIDLLLLHGADINQRMPLDYTALHAAASWSSPAVVSHLLARGADPSAITQDYTRETPADIAKHSKRGEVHKILREAMGQGPNGLPLA